MHYTELPKWVATDAIALFAKEMDLTEDELQRSEWTDTEDFIDPKVNDTRVNWEKMTSGNWWVTVDLKAYLFWVAFTHPNNSDSDIYLWQQLCQGCCQTRDHFSMAKVELQDGRTVELPLCDRICAPDFWDDVEPGEWITLDQAYTLDETKPEVRLADWMCEHCASVCPHGMMALLFDSEWEPPTKTIVCSVCQKKEPGRFLAQVPQRR